MNQTKSVLRAASAALFIGTILFVASGGAVPAGGTRRVGFTNQFPIADCAALVNSTATGARNRYFPLEIGRVWELSNQRCVDAGDCDELEEVRVSVLNQTQMVNGVLTRVVEERGWVDG